MSGKVSIKLKHIKYSPWGIFREVSTPFGVVTAEPLLWVTEQSLYDEIERTFLGEGEIQKIISAHLLGKIEILGGIDLEKPKEEPPETKKSSLPESLPSGREQLIMDVSSILEKEKIVKERFEELSKRGPTQVGDFMGRPAHLVKRDLKKVAKQGAGLRFFQQCREFEEKEKNRKTVLSLLIDIIQRKIAIIGTDKVIDRQTGLTVLDDAYFDSIEEEEEDNEKEEVKEN